MTPDHTPRAQRPEHWLLVSDDSARLFAATQALPATTCALTRWRLKHGLVQRLPLAGLWRAIDEALATGAPAVWVHAECDAHGIEALQDDWCLRADERGVHPARVQFTAWAADDDVTLRAQLARPDAWVELGLLHAGFEDVPPLRAESAGPEMADEHEAAVRAWMSSSEGEAVRQRSIELTELLTEARELIEEDERDTLRPQNEPGSVPRPSLGEPSDLLSLAEPSPSPRRRTVRGMLGASAGRASSLGGRNVEVLHTWKPAQPKGAKAVSAPLYEANLLFVREHGQDTLELELRLHRLEAWKGRRDVQVWLFPPLMRPVQLAMGDADDHRIDSHSGAYLLRAKLPRHRLRAQDYAQVLLKAQLHLDAPVTG